MCANSLVAGFAILNCVVQLWYQPLFIRMEASSVQKSFLQVSSSQGTHEI